MAKFFSIGLISFILCVTTFGFAANRGAKVASIQPTPHSMISPEEVEIVAEFDQPIDPNSVDARSFQVFGRWLGVCPGAFIFEANNQRIRFIPQKTFSAGEWITVNLSKAIKSAAGENMVTGYAWNFWTKTTPGSMDLIKTATIDVKQAGEGPIRTYGAYAGDLNGDGFPDFTVPNEDASDVRVFLNDGFGNYSSFDIYSLPANSFPSTNEGADFNGDGFLDFAVGNIAAGTASVFLGDGTGKFLPPATYATAGGTRGLCVLDLNGDGATDIVTANRVGNNISILINNGNGTFAQSVNMDAGVDGETSCVAADANNDGILDVFVGGFNSNKVAVLLGDGDGSLSLASVTAAGGVAWMIAAGDIDNDGNVDVVSANSFRDEFALLRGDGAGNLSSAEKYDTGNFPLAIDLGDLDGDGDLDLVTSNFFSGDWLIFENDGAGNFSNPRTLLTGQAGSCAVFHDRDLDGDLDMTGIDELDDVLVLFENKGVDTHVAESGFPATVKDFRLYQSYPNPFSKSGNFTFRQTNHILIPFSLEKSAQVRLEIINVNGQIIELLLDSNLSPGNYSSDFSPQNLPAGIYFYRLSTKSVVLTRKIVLLP